ncbi:MAG: hypothetical protein H0T12_00120 [Actinobacteria bacterium]|nr:hypothetical protein [Actinomycetota bacterium]
MPQAVWTGQLSFGLVNIPVKLYSATAPKNVRFHQYDAQTGRRIRYRRVASGPPAEHIAPPEPAQPDERAPPVEPALLPPDPEPSPAPSDDPAARPLPRTEPPPGWREEVTDEPADEAEVPWDEIIKGFEIEPGRVVTVTPEELVSVAPEQSRLLEVERFVHLNEIDPIHFDKSYYVTPGFGVGADRSYWLLYKAMEAAAEVAVGRFVMRTKEYLAVVRPGEHVLMLETLFYADEVRDPKEVWIPPTEEPPERELRMARNLIEALTGEWDPARHRDEYRERLLELLRSKSDEDVQVLPEPEEKAPSPVIDLMEALKASVEVAKLARSANGSA